MGVNGHERLSNFTLRQWRKIEYYKESTDLPLINGKFVVHLAVGTVCTDRCKTNLHTTNQHLFTKKKTVLLAV